MLSANDFSEKKTADFLDENIALLYSHQIDFQSLTNKYTSNTEFLNIWLKNLACKPPSPRLSGFEYIVNLLPVFLGALTSIFGLLLALSNFKMFSGIFGNFTVLAYSAVASIILTVLGVTAIYRHLRKIDLQISFRNWFYLGLLFRLSEKNHILKLNPESAAYFKTLFSEAVHKLPIAKTPNIDNFIKKFRKQLSHERHNTARFQQLIDNTMIATPQRMKQYFIHEHENTKSNAIFKKIWQFVNTRIVNQQDIWDVTVNNLGMATGIVGVLLGSAKTIAHFFERKETESLLGGSVSASYGVVIMVVLMIFNFYCRIKARKYSARRDALVHEQSEFITKAVELVRILHSGHHK